MRDAATALHSTRGGLPRSVRAIERVRERNRVAVATSVDQTCWACIDAGSSEVAVLQVRAGKLTKCAPSA